MHVEKRYSGATKVRLTALVESLPIKLFAIST
jgi:hypothetical protein